MVIRPRLQLPRRLGLALGLGLIISLITLATAWASIVKLSPGLPATADVSGFQISRDGRYVVFQANPQGYNEIFSVPSEGGTPVRLNLEPEYPPFQAGAFQISPDSRWVVYSLPPKSGAGLQTSAELYRVPITGPFSDSVKLNSALVSGGNVLGFQISPDSQWVVYRADQSTDTVHELWSVPLQTPAPAVKLNDPLAPNGDVATAFGISPDSARVVYVADQAVDEVVELYSVPIGGPASAGTKLNGALVSGGDVGAASAYFAISPDSTRVLYVADQETDGFWELYSVPLIGQASAVKLSPTPMGGQGVSPDLIISPDSGYAILRAPDAVSGRVDLYSVPLAGPASAALQLNDPGVDGRTIMGAGVSREDGLVFFYMSQPTSGYTAYVVPVAGPASAAVKLAETFDTFRQDPTANYLVYDRLQTVFAVPVTGPASAAVQLNALPIEGSQGYAVSPDGSRVVYLSDNTASGGELYSVPIAGVYSDSVKISGPLIAGGTVEYLNGFGFGPDGGWVAYRADAETVGLIDLFATDLGRPAPAHQIFLPVARR